MSHVVTVIVTCSALDWDPVNPDALYTQEGVALVLVGVQEWLAGQRKGQLTNLGPHFGGGKAPQQGVYGGAFNYLDIAELLERIAAAPWECPEDVQVFVNGEHDSDFTAYRQPFIVADHHRSD